VKSSTAIIPALFVLATSPTWATDKSGSDMGEMDMGSMQGGSAPADARDPYVYSDGLASDAGHGSHMMGDTLFGSVLLEKFEYFHTDDDTEGVRLDGKAWYGSDYNKLWLKADGGRSEGRNSATRMEALWDHALTPYWSTQLGVRHDAWEGPGRDWAVLGIQGLAPYWFDVEAAFYAGEDGRTAIRGAVNYDLLLTQRLILQPNLEFNAYGKDDADRGIGSGLSDVELGLRLRYEIRREFAPYVGVSWHRKLGDTADYARAEGADKDEAQLLLGVRLWY